MDEHVAKPVDEDRKKALECGMDGFLSKAIVIEELIAALQHNLDQVSGVSENHTNKGNKKYG